MNFVTSVFKKYIHKGENREQSRNKYDTTKADKEPPGQSAKTVEYPGASEDKNVSTCERQKQVIPGSTDEDESFQDAQANTNESSSDFQGTSLKIEHDSLNNSMIDSLESPQFQGMVDSIEYRDGNNADIEEEHTVGGEAEEYESLHPLETDSIENLSILEKSAKAKERELLSHNNDIFLPESTFKAHEETTMSSKPVSLGDILFDSPHRNQNTIDETKNIQRKSNKLEECVQTPKGALETLIKNVNEAMITNNLQDSVEKTTPGNSCPNENISHSHIHDRNQKTENDTQYIAMKNKEVIGTRLKVEEAEPKHTGDVKRDVSKSQNKHTPQVKENLHVIVQPAREIPLRNYMDVKIGNENDSEPAIMEKCEDVVQNVLEEKLDKQDAKQEGWNQNVQNLFSNTNKLNSIEGNEITLNVRGKEKEETFLLITSKALLDNSDTEKWETEKTQGNRENKFQELQQKTSHKMEENRKNEMNEDQGPSKPNKFDKLLRQHVTEEIAESVLPSSENKEKLNEPELKPLTKNEVKAIEAESGLNLNTSLGNVVANENDNSSGKSNTSDIEIIEEETMQELITLEAQVTKDTVNDGRRNKVDSNDTDTKLLFKNLEEFQDNFDKIVNENNIPYEKQDTKEYECLEKQCEKNVADSQIIIKDIMEERISDTVVTQTKSENNSGQAKASSTSFNRKGTDTIEMIRNHCEESKYDTRSLLERNEETETQNYQENRKEPITFFDRQDPREFENLKRQCNETSKDMRMKNAISFSRQDPTEFENLERQYNESNKDTNVKSDILEALVAESIYSRNNNSNEIQVKSSITEVEIDNHKRLSETLIHGVKVDEDNSEKKTSINDCDKESAKSSKGLVNSEIDEIVSTGRTDCCREVNKEESNEILFQRQDTREFENLERQCNETNKDVNVKNDILQALVAESLYSHNNDSNETQVKSRITEVEIDNHKILSERLIQGGKVDENNSEKKTSVNNCDKESAKPSKGLVNSEIDETVSTGRTDCFREVKKQESNEILFDRQDTREFENLERQCNETNQNINVKSDILEALVAETVCSRNNDSNETQVKSNITEFEIDKHKILSEILIQGGKVDEDNSEKKTSVNDYDKESAKSSKGLVNSEIDEAVSTGRTDYCREVNKEESNEILFDRQDTREFENLERQCNETNKDIKIKNDILQALVAESVYSRNNDNNETQVKSSISEVEIDKHKIVSETLIQRDKVVEDNNSEKKTSVKDFANDCAEESVKSSIGIVNSEIDETVSTGRTDCSRQVNKENSNEILFDRQDTREFENLESQCNETSEDKNVKSDILQALVAESVYSRNNDSKETQVKSSISEVEIDKHKILSETLIQRDKVVEDNSEKKTSIKDFANDCDKEPVKSSIGLVNSAIDETVSTSRTDCCREVNKENSNEILFDRHDTRESENLERQCNETNKDINVKNDILEALVEESVYSYNNYSNETQVKRSTTKVEADEQKKLSETLIQEEKVVDDNSEKNTNIKDSASNCDKQSAKSRKGLVNSEKAENDSTGRADCYRESNKEELNEILFNRQGTREFQNLGRQSNETNKDMNIKKDILEALVAETVYSQDINSNEMQITMGTTKVELDRHKNLLPEMLSQNVKGFNEICFDRQDTKEFENLEKQCNELDSDKNLKNDVLEALVSESINNHDCYNDNEQVKLETKGILDDKKKSFSSKLLSQEYVCLQNTEEISNQGYVANDKYIKGNLIADEHKSIDKIADIEVASKLMRPSENLGTLSIRTENESTSNTQINTDKRGKVVTTVEVRPNVRNKKSSITMVVEETPRMESQSYGRDNEELINKVELLQEQLDSVKKSGRKREPLVTSTQDNKENGDVIPKYKNLLKEYEKRIAKQNESLEKLKMESKENARHFTNTEMAFSDIFEKYEKAKSVIAAYCRNEDVLLENIQNAEEQLSKIEAKCISMKQQSVEHIRRANEQLEEERRRYKKDIARLEAQAKRLEIHACSLEIALKQKTDECQALAALCDDITGRKST